jgi:DNA polymerase III alpha subunit
MQWVFETYGRNHAAFCSIVIRYRDKGALSDIGKALGLTEDMIKMLSSQVWGWSEEGVAMHDENSGNFANAAVRLTTRRLRRSRQTSGLRLGAQYVHQPLGWRTISFYWYYSYFR